MPGQCPLRGPASPQPYRLLSAPGMRSRTGRGHFITLLANIGCGYGRLTSKLEGPQMLLGGGKSARGSSQTVASTWESSLAVSREMENCHVPRTKHSHSS